MRGPLPHDELARVARQLNLPGLGLGEQQQLFDAHVAVIGAGGLGCPLLVSLAAAGVGEITLLDDDTVDASNLQRQTLFRAEDVGRLKVEAAAERLAGLAPGMVLHAVARRFAEGNAVAVARSVDLLIDGSDNFATKYLAADAAEITGTPLIWGTVLRFSGQSAVFWSGPGAPDGTAVGLRDLFPNQPAADSVPDCATAGVLGATTAVVGNLMATNALGWLTGLHRRVGEIASYQAFPPRLSVLRVGHDPQRDWVQRLGSYGQACAAAPPETAASSVAGAVAAGELPAIDLREPHEVMLRPFTGVDAFCLPLSTLSQSADPEDAAEVVAAALRQAAGDDGDAVVVACAAGARSARFIEQYSELAAGLGITLLNLPGGIDSWRT